MVTLAPCRKSIVTVSCFRLTNEYMDDEGMRYRGVASDLMRDGVANPKAYYCIGNGTKLSNLTEAMLSFKVSITYLLACFSVSRTVTVRFPVL